MGPDRLVLVGGREGEGGLVVGGEGSWDRLEDAHLIVMPMKAEELL